MTKFNSKIDKIVIDKQNLQQPLSKIGNTQLFWRIILNLDITCICYPGNCSDQCPKYQFHQFRFFRVPLSFQNLWTWIYNCATNCFLQVAGYSCPEEEFGFLGGDLVNVFQFYFASPLSFSFFFLLFVTKNPGWHLWRCYLARMWYLFSTLSTTCQRSFPSPSLIFKIHFCYFITPVHRHDVWAHFWLSVLDLYQGAWGFLD